MKWLWWSFFGDLFIGIIKDAINFLLVPIYFLFLSTDAIVYSMVAYSYSLFEIIARLNLSTLFAWFGPFLDRVNSLVIVIVMFTIGYALVNYLINPDKVADSKIGGVAIIKNLAIATALLISYQTAFEVLGESTFLIIGAPQQYEYNHLKNWFGVTNDGNPGLLSNLIFGKMENQEVGKNFGITLAVKTLKIFLHESSGSSGTILNSVYNIALSGALGDYNLLGITACVFDINFINPSSANVDYHYPIVSTVVGIYMIYSLVSFSLELGVRAFKLIVLQVVAPLAIVTIIKDGMTAKVWTKWYKLLGKTYIDIFLRVGSMYLVIALMEIAWSRIGELFDSDPNVSGFTGALVTILLILAGLRFAKKLPEFIDSIFGSHLAEANKNGFGDFMKSLGGGIVGGTVGLASGIAAGKANKLSGGATAWNGIRSGFNGARDGAKSKKISDAVKSATSTAQNARKNAEGMRDRGGTLRSNLGFAYREKTGKNYAGLRQLDADAKKESAAYAQQKADARAAFDREQQQIRGKSEPYKQKYQQARDAATRDTKTASDAYQKQHGAAEATRKEAQEKFERKRQTINENKAAVKETYDQEVRRVNEEIKQERTTLTEQTTKLTTKKTEAAKLSQEMAQKTYTDKVDDTGKVLETAAQQRAADQQKLDTLTVEVQQLETTVQEQHRKVVVKETEKANMQASYTQTAAKYDEQIAESAAERDAEVSRADAEDARAQSTYTSEIQRINNERESARLEYESRMSEIQEEERKATEKYNEDVAKIEEAHTIRTTGKDRYGRKVGTPGESFEDRRKFYTGTTGKKE